MALSPTVLSADLRSVFLATPATMATDCAALTAMCDVIAACVVNHITVHGIVTVLGTGSTLTGVPVPPGGGPVAITLGTATGSIA